MHSDIEAQLCGVASLRIHTSSNASGISVDTRNFTSSHMGYASCYARASICLTRQACQLAWSENGILQHLRPLPVFRRLNHSAKHQIKHPDPRNLANFAVVAVAFSSGETPRRSVHFNCFETTMALQLLLRAGNFEGARVPCRPSI
jgi:hypothetical protein